MVQCQNSWNLNPDEYVLFMHCGGTLLFATTSDGVCKSLDVMSGSLNNVYRLAHPIGTLCDDNGQTVLLASSQGEISLCDVRSSGPQWSITAPTLLASIACQNNLIAVGTELVNSDAGILLYDIRAPNVPIISFLDCHNDDVTDVSFASNPALKNVVVSGSTDGIVNLYNISIHDENEAVYQALNHGSSIHLARFLSENRVLALSHMETLSIYDVCPPTETRDETHFANKEFGDLRESWNCQYVSSFANNHFLVGDNSNELLWLVPFTNEEAGLPIYLDGAHGEELARCMSWYGNCLFTGGEDGTIKLWNPSQKPLHEKRRGPIHNREKIGFRPY